jgi:hypothetical protein
MDNIIVFHNDAHMSDSTFFVIKKAKSPGSLSSIKLKASPCVACCDASLNNLYPLSLYTIWVKPEQSIPNGVLPPKDKERLNIKNEVYQVLLSLIPFTLLPSNSKPPVFMVSLLINESEAPRGIGISKLEGPVTYSTRSEFKVIRQKAN